jgi:hypothetical protein
MLVVSLKLSAACCFRVCVQLCDLTTCIHLRPCTIASAPKFSVASLFPERRFFHGYRHSRLNVEPSSRLQLAPCWALPERSGCVASTNPNVHPSGAYHFLTYLLLFHVIRVYISHIPKTASTFYRRQTQLLEESSSEVWGTQSRFYAPKKSRARIRCAAPHINRVQFYSLFLGPS